MNDENLRMPTPSEARANGRKGGIASGKARREKKLMREAIQQALALEVASEKTKDVLRQLGFEDNNNQAAMIVAALNKALKGDIKAMEFLRDTAGEKPAEQYEILEPPTIIDDIPND